MVKALTKKYKDLVAVDQVSFEVEKGHPVAILGKNGAGKSTIIKMLLGLVPPTDGAIDIPEGLRVGYLPEERGAYQDVTVENQLKLFAKLSGVRNASAAVNQWIDRFELSHYRKFPMKALSKGNAQRVQFAIALINDPDILILDEPLSGLDPISAQMFEHIILEESKNKYLITTSHNMNYVEFLCENVVLLDRGHQVVGGKIDDIKLQYGKRKLEVPANDEMKERLSKYPFVVDNRRIVVEDFCMEEYLNFINGAPFSERTQFINYGYESMEEIFIRLLGSRYV